MEEKWTNNLVELCGVLVSRPWLSHRNRNDTYYCFSLEVSRLSGATDKINIVARRETLEEMELEEKSRIAVEGELRSYNNKSGNGNRLVITVFARKLYFTDDEDKNLVLLSGALCKPPTLRKTPMGREICDLMLAVNRRYGRSDYLPCIAWGENAEAASGWPLGSRVTVSGRIQSRTYIKMEAGQPIEKTAYEVSATMASEGDTSVSTNLN